MKDIEKYVGQLKIRKDQAEEYRESARRQTERKIKLETEMAQLSRDKAELETKLKEAHERYREAEKVKLEMQRKETRLDELERNRRDLESDMTRVINSSEDELKQKIRKFQLTKVKFPFLD